MRTNHTIFSLCMVASLSFAQPVQIVVPNNLADVEGNSSMSDFLNASSFRMQMVFDASQFSALGPGPSNSVNSIWFRPDGASTYDVLTVFGGGSVTLSTTRRAPDNLSPVFVDNVGANAVTVYTGAMGFGGGYVPGANPQPFGNSIVLTTPFYYSPSQGNLLLDIRGRSGQVLFPGSLDAQSVGGDSVSRVFATSELSVSGAVDSLGWVAQFNITVIPEPAPCILAIVGFATMLCLRRR